MPFFCPHEREAKRNDMYDPLWWEEHPCFCKVCVPQYVVLGAMLTIVYAPLILAGRAYAGIKWSYDKAIHRNQEPEDDDEFG